jgi:hypothetical protein
LARGRDADDADGGDSNSGVDAGVPESTFASLTIRGIGVEIREAFGVGDLLYTPEA